MQITRSLSVQVGSAGPTLSTFTRQLLPTIFLTQFTKQQGWRILYKNKSGAWVACLLLFSWTVQGDGEVDI